ncbi:recombinase family protein [Clostridium cellulovorans]|uniref:Resolvase domain n=1 Tax=Clostridium cellulovorans (strain ATCC 35296 / DSM 3052 / OCM 3 / 743B) TaxID=573061 RepID=D9SLP1_CLOC7|nr:recombinase family protein [Clostridium cellulovorans]ADL53678.1 Resolvase domain [Clostridium cellulovorans 743B]
MAKRLDAARIEKARHSSENSSNRREEEKQRIQDTIAKNRSGERRGRVIMPEKKMYAFQEAKKIRVAAYCRVSTAEEAQVGSFEMQVQHFQSVIDSNPNYELVKIYTDEGISGTSINKRKGFQEMIEDACAGKIDLILTKSISRFGRNIVDILTTLRQLGDLNPPVAVHFESEGINTSDAGNKLLISILSALAELESQQKSIAIKEGIRYRMQEGLYKFSVRNTIGYYRDYAGRVKIEPAEAEIVHYIFDSFTGGATPQEIADSLTAQGIRSPKGKECWNVSTIKGILRNEKYVGDVLYQKTYSKDYLSHKSVKNDDVLPQWYWENVHPAIIKRNQWLLAQELLQKGKWTKRGNKPIAAIQKKFTVSRVKSGALRGFFILDMAWSNDERDQFIKIINSINELEEAPTEERK